VKGNLTLRLQNVPWDQALDIIMRTKGLAMRQNGNVIFIAPTEEIAAREKLDLESRKTVEELVPLRTEIIQVNYAKAANLAKLLKSGDEKKGSILSPRGTVETDERTNSLIVKDVPDKLVEVRELVTQLDKPVRQVMIDSRVVIASDTFARDIGVRFGVSGVSQTGDGRLNTLSGGLGATDTMVNSAVGNLISTGQPFPVAVPALADRLGVDLAAAAGAPSIAFAILGADYLVDLELSALQTEGQGEVISNPRVVSADNPEEPAVIEAGEEIPYTVPGSTSGPPTTQFKPAVLKLEVTPRINPDDRIFMKLAVKKDQRGADAEQAGGGTAPAINTRKIVTTVLVNNGETVVLGGIFEQEKVKGQDKVPLLGDIPLLGYLFQRNANETTKRELLIFVTPQILKEGRVAE
jgi:type IV pilus assembly protein PilQ